MQHVAMQAAEFALEPEIELARRVEGPETVRPLAAVG